MTSRSFPLRHLWGVSGDTNSIRKRMGKLGVFEDEKAMQLTNCKVQSKKKMGDYTDVFDSSKIIHKDTKEL